MNATLEANPRSVLAARFQTRQPIAATFSIFALIPRTLGAFYTTRSFRVMIIGTRAKDFPDGLVFETSSNLC